MTGRIPGLRGLAGNARSALGAVRGAVSLSAPRPRADAGAVADLAELLSAAWRTPDRELVAAWRDGVWQEDVRDALSRLGLGPDAGRAGPRAGGASDAEVAAGALGVLDRASGAAPGVDALLEAVGAEHASLFLGPPHALVGFHECQWLDGPDVSLFVAPSTVAVEAAYRQAGVAPSTREPADMLPAELEFLALLAAREVTGDGDDARTDLVARQLRQAFWHQHLGLWLEDLGVAVQRATEHGAYAALGRLTAAVARSGRLGD